MNADRSPGERPIPSSSDLIPAEACWRSLASDTQDLLVVIDAEGRIREINREGDSRTEYGQPFARFVCEESRDTFEETFEAMKESGRTQTCPLNIVDKNDDRVRLFACRTSPIWREGGIIGATLIGTRSVGIEFGVPAGTIQRIYLLRKQLGIQDRDRRMVAYEIHDGLIQDVVGAQMLLESLAGRLPDGDAALEQFERVGRLLRNAIDEGRRLITELRPMIIDERGIVDAIQYLISEEQSTGDLQVDYRHDVESEDLPAVLGGTLYRIVQEALSNIRRHSEAGRVVVELGEREDGICLSIVDDGVGFDPNDVAVGSFGLQGIRERAMLFGGEANVQSAPGQGTRIEVTLPRLPTPLTGDEALG